jgi:hypothetical protein
MLTGEPGREYRLPIYRRKLHMSIDVVKKPVALVQMTWGAVSQASIALGILKQLAQKQGFAVDVHYLNIQFASTVGFDLYETISVRSALDPEWFFSSALFGPGGLNLIRNSWDDLLHTETGMQTAERLTTLTGSESKCREIADEIIPEFIDDCLTRIDSRITYAESSLMYFKGESASRGSSLARCSLVLSIIQPSGAKA